MDKKQFKMVAEQPEVTFNVTFMPEETDVYQGALSVTPTRETQELETAGFTFLKNLTVEGIPDQYVDVSADTVTAETLAEGATAHDANGNAVVGVAKISDRDYKADLVNLIQRDTVNTIPDGITKIGDYAFYSTAGAKSGITFEKLPDTITEVGQYAFYGCENLALDKLPKGLKTIGNYGFKNCKKITITELPDGIEEVKSYAFDYCTSIKTMRLPDGIKRIGENAFSNCFALEAVNIPKNVTYIGYGAFYQCSKLKTVRVEAVTPPDTNGGIFNYINGLTIYVPKGTIDAYKVAKNWKNYAAKFVEEDA